MTGQTEAPAPGRRSERSSGITSDVNGAPYDPRCSRYSRDGLFRGRHCLLSHLAAQQDARLTLTGKRAEIMSFQAQARLFAACLLWVRQAHHHLSLCRKKAEEERRGSWGSGEIAQRRVDIVDIDIVVVVLM